MRSGTGLANFPGGSRHRRTVPWCKTVVTILKRNMRTDFFERCLKAVSENKVHPVCPRIQEDTNMVRTAPSSTN